MKKEVIISICAVVLIVILGIVGWSFTHPKFDKSNPIVFEQKVNDDYASIIYEGREYVPYCAISPRERDCYLGYVGEDEQDKVYTCKNYSEVEWLISSLETGATIECMLYKEKNVTNIPDGLSSEYEWNNTETKGNSNVEKSNNEIDKENIDIEELKQIAQKYYDKTVYEVVSMELKSLDNNKVRFEVVSKKDGVLVNPNRTISLEKENGEWKVTNEGY